MYIIHLFSFSGEGLFFILKVNFLPCPVQSQNINNNERMSNFKLNKYLYMIKNNSANNVEADT